MSFWRDAYFLHLLQPRRSPAEVAVLETLEPVRDEERPLVVADADFLHEARAGECSKRIQLSFRSRTAQLHDLGKASTAILRCTCTLIQ